MMLLRVLKMYEQISQTPTIGHSVNPAESEDTGEIIVWKCQAYQDIKQASSTVSVIKPLARPIVQADKDGTTTPLADLTGSISTLNLSSSDSTHQTAMERISTIPTIGNTVKSAELPEETCELQMVVWKPQVYHGSLSSLNRSSADSAHQTGMEIDAPEVTDVYPEQIPNPWVRSHFQAPKPIATPSAGPQWAGYYYNTSSSCSTSSAAADSTPEAAFEKIHPFVARRDIVVPSILANFKPDCPTGEIPGHTIITGAGNLLLIRTADLSPAEAKALFEYLKQNAPVLVPAADDAQTTWQHLKPNRQGAVVTAAAKVGGRRRGKAPRASRTSRPPPPGEVNCQNCPSCRTWRPLLVLDMHEAEAQELPKAMSSWVDEDKWDYRGVQASMVAEGDSFTVILTFSRCVCVYESKRNSWICQRWTPGHAPWILVNPSMKPWDWVSAQAEVGGRFYYADVVHESNAKKSRGEYLLRVFEVDVEAATWSLHRGYVLKKRKWRFPASYHCGLLMNPPSLLNKLNEEIDLTKYTEIVECMGELYAVIPALHDDYFATEFTSIRTLDDMMRANVKEGFQIVGAQFHIVRLQGGNHDSSGHRVLRILVPEADLIEYAAGSELDRRSFFGCCFDNRYKPEGGNWFCCMARGSVIFVSCGLYLLQFDVVSGESKTGIMRDTDLSVAANIRYDLSRFDF